ncbi:MAG TPA: cupin domain-containing protein [Acidimicrobiales bacterium]|nr:cupin domain-containing protein [Acidimicrobiales bacterium]
MEVVPKPPSVKGPAQYFTGDVWIDTVARPTDAWRLNVSAVRFSPGARTAWHSHDVGQTLFVTEGRGLVQTQGEPVIEIRAGDVIFAPDGEVHWHGATAEHFMTHLSMTEGDAHWGDHVTEAEYPDGS